MSNNLEIENKVQQSDSKVDSVPAPKRVNLSHLGSPQPTPEELINQGKGSGEISVCQKL